MAEKQVLKMPAMISKREEKRLEMPDVREDMVVVVWLIWLIDWGRLGLWGLEL